MAEWVTVASLLGFGLILLFIELLFVPGTTVIGIAGFFCCFLGVYFSFSYFGGDTGELIFLGTLAVASVGIFWSLKKGTWRYLALNKVLSGTVNEEDEPLIIGESGVAISDLRPSGKADFSGQVREVNTLGYHVNSGREVRIVKIVGKKIYVEPIREVASLG